jgi:hypothetical protein
MTTKSVKLSTDEETKETEVFSFYGVQGETYSEQYRDFLSKIHKATRLTIAIEAPENPSVHPIPNFPNFSNFRCPLRRTITVNHKDPKTGTTLWSEKKIICVNNPPQKTFVDDIAICEVCLEKFYGNTKRILAANPNTQSIAKAKVEAEETPAPQPIDIPAATRQLFLAHYDGRKHCPFTGDRIFSQTCCLCSTQNPKRWTDCRALVMSLITTQKTPIPSP